MANELEAEATLELSRTHTAPPRAPRALVTEELPPVARSGPPAHGLSTRYRLGRELARGGLAMIREADDLVLGRRVAVKQPLATDALARARFAHEARVASRLAHPGIVPIYDIGVDELGIPFFAMKWVDGRSLHDLIGERETLDGRLALIPNLIAVAEAIAYAHTQDVIHRDLKPANVIVGAFGETVVIDWGLALAAGASGASEATDGTGAPARDAAVPSSDARLTREGTVVGTPAYMAPEQAGGDDVDHRADVYALGASLYHLISGEPSYASAQDARDGDGDAAPGTSATDPVWVRVLTGPPRSIVELVPATPPELVTIVERAMARDRRDRYVDAEACAEALRGFLAHHDSHQLAVAAGERQRELTIALAAMRVDEPIARAAIYRQADVVRFGYEQALQAWPANPVALAGLRRHREQMFDFELAAGNLAAATALAGELPPDDDRAARLAERTVELERRAAEADAFARARDRTIGGPERVVLLATCAAMLAYFFIDAIAGDFAPDRPAAASRLLRDAALVGAVGVGVMIGWRRRLFANDFSRRASRLVLAVMLLTATDRGIAVATAQPATFVLATDLLIVAAGLFVFGGLAIHLGAVALAAAWLCALAPVTSLYVYNAIMVGFVSVLAWSWSRAADRSPGPSRSP